RGASAADTRVLIVGGRQHIDKGNPSEADAELWTTLLDDRIAYDPAEMLCVVEAGMRIHDLRAMPAEGGQEWPVDAPDDATVGGVIAAGVTTVRQLRVGAMRDSIVEMEVVTGDGRLVKSGARTVKNVTGYDVHRLLTGSLGTLGTIVHVALKVRPLPKATRTLANDDGGLELGRRVLDAIPLPAAVLAEPDRLVVRLEGWPEEVQEQVVAAGAIAPFDDTEAPFPEACFPDATNLAAPAVDDPEPIRNARSPGRPEPLPRRFQRLQLLAEGEPEEMPSQLGTREEGRTRNGRNAPVFDEVPRRRHVVVESERRDIGHHVVRALRRVRREARGREDLQHEVAALGVLLPDLLVVLAGQAERRDTADLQRRGGRDRQEIVRRTDPRHQRRRGHRPSDAPARDGVRLRQRADRDGALAHPGKGGDRHVLAILVRDVLVDLIGDR